MPQIAISRKGRSEGGDDDDEEEDSDNGMKDQPTTVTFTTPTGVACRLTTTRCLSPRSTSGTMPVDAVFVFLTSLFGAPLNMALPSR